MLNLKHTLLLIFVLLFPVIVLGHSADYPHEENIPENLQIVKATSLSEVQKLTLLSAFIGGILLFFAPCSIGILPAYFAFSFKNKTKLVLMTTAFFIGFASFNAFLGLGASVIGNWLLIHQPKMVLLSGLLILAFGFASILGISFNMFNIKNKLGNSFVENIIFGALFSFGYAGCAGPIVFSILTLASTLPILIAVLLMFVYSLGISIPLIIFSFFFDKIHIFEKPIFQKSIKFRLLGKEVNTGLTNIISGSIFIFLGIIYLIYNSTGVFHQLPIDITQPIYDFVYGKQKIFINMFNLPIFNIVGLLIIIGLLLLLTKELRVNNLNIKIKKKRR